MSPGLAPNASHPLAISTYSSRYGLIWRDLKHASPHVHEEDETVALVLTTAQSHYSTAKMVSDTATSSRASVISLDPAVASQITGTTFTGATSHSRTGSSPLKGLGSLAPAPSSHGHVRNKSVPLQLDKQHTLRRAKNSTEVLRQRSTRSSKKPQKLEPLADSRGGRNFTVGNVGSGGILYLKPSSHQNASAHASPPALMPLTAPADLALNYEHKFHPSKPPNRSDTVSPAQRSASPRGFNASVARRPTIETVRSKHGRSQSFSTIDEHQGTMAGKSRTLKIVINRPDSAKPGHSQEDDDIAPQLNSPALEVPIPHYRLGNPRFSTNGTPVMLASSFTRSSNASEVTESPGARTPRHTSATGPPASSLRAFQRLDYGYAKESGANGRGDTSSGSDSPVHEPIRPEIFDALANIYDDPDIVRYSHNVREVTAATPARLIAQISSESFMDYELVSDFFLTFRTYMSIYAVLDLLLARLCWAINRQEDDGRIIRVRTFAALRHWILNYFMDDFMPDRKLRLRFCNEINHMYQEVSRRRTAGTSDLKVLRDLKRCWNGRCSTYWDSDEFILDGDQDEDLLPGGSDEPEPEKTQLLDKPPPLPRNVRTISNSSWFDIPPVAANRAQHGKQASVASDQSLQAKSCSIPKNLLKPIDVTAAERGSHPVPVQLRRPNATGNLEVHTGHLGHRRGAASIDSDREPTPRNEKPEPILINDRSVIRGSMYAPCAPFVQIVSSPSMPAVSRMEDRQDYAGNMERRSSPQSAHSPGVKNIFGSLRKALGGKHAHSDAALMTVSAPMPVQDNTGAQRAQLPLNMSRSHDELRARSQAVQAKGQLRVDLLCAQVAQNYELLFPHAKYAKHDSNFGQDLEHPATDHGPRAGMSPRLLTPDLRRDRLPSHTTAQSGSILIVNDTGMGIPTMSGGLPPQSSLRAAWEAQATAKDIDVADAAVGLGLEHGRPKLVDVSPQRSSDALGEMVEARNGTSPRVVQLPFESNEEIGVAIASSSPRPHTQSPASSTPTTRQRASGQSTDPSRAVTSVRTATSSASPANVPPAHGLRRRPGGDLRNNENVHDLEQHQHHNSMDTTTTADTMPTGSPVQSISGHAGPPPKKSVSMINTHSSQHLRPSFEKAVAGFSCIPDDDDGGLEATLLKLEGRYEKQSPPLPQHPLDALERRRSMPEMSIRSTLEPFDAAEAPDVHRGYVRQANMMPRGSLDDFNFMDQSRYPERGVDDRRNSEASSIFGLPVESENGDGRMYDPSPLLKQDTNSTSGPSQSTGQMYPSPLHLQQEFRSPGQDQMTPSRTHFDQYVRPQTAGESAQSFLLDEDENFSDLSSEISVDVINYAPNGRSMSPLLAAPGTAVSGLEIPQHPLTYASVVNLAPQEQQRDSIVMANPQPYAHLPLPKMMMSTAPQYGNRASGGPAHIPFILAADSQVIAQQMTLIEKSALTEIEWSDLVEMKWRDTSSKVLDWAEYLTKGDISGIDLVTARFNLVSRWVRSEIVLTQDIEERAQVITKYIHVAAHARRLHNYATMVQITIGLTSTDTTRLIKTWERVPSPDKSLLKNMERLVQPVRNFYELRMEIEQADFSDGCIPFIGLYVHDLTYNAQKPATIPTQNDREPLINFERYRTSAVIVKNLLRLIDASSRYSFDPIRGLVERCLWMAALPDDKIYALSRALEVS